MGAVIGLALQAAAISVVLAGGHAGTVDELLHTAATTPALWLAFVSPVILAIAGYAIDRRYERASAHPAVDHLAESIRDLDRKRRELEDECHNLSTGASDLHATNVLMSMAVRRFEELFQGMPVACFSFDVDGKIVEWNRASESFFQLAAKDVSQRMIWDCLPGASSGMLSAEGVARVLAGETIAGHEWTFVGRDGAVKHVLCSAFPLRGADQQITGGISANIDISARKTAEDSQKRLTDILESTPDFVATACPDGRLLYLNAAARRTIGLRPSAPLDDLTLENLLPASAAGKVVAEAITGASRKGIWSGEVPILAHHGRTIPHSQVMIAHKAPGGAVRYFSIIARDISLRKHYEEEILQYTQMLEAANASLEELATQDGLTNLYNHRAFQERLKTEWEVSDRYNHNLSIIMLDVDRFKEYNDTYGHPAGDRVLKHVAGVLQELARAADMAARYGGEEFALIAPSTDRDGALVLAERLRVAIESRPWDLRPVTASFGVATRTDFMIDYSQLIAAADAALYDSKKKGRNRVTAASPSAIRAAAERQSAKAA